MPDALLLHGIGQILLIDKMSLKIMGIFVILAISQLVHQFGRSIAQMQRHGQVSRLLHHLQGRVDGIVGRIAFRACRQIDGSLGQRYASFGPAYLGEGIKAGVGYQLGIGIGQTYILRR